MIHVKSDTVTVFLRKERAADHAKAIETDKPGRKARVVDVTLHEASGGITYGHAVRFREPLGAWQLA